MKHAFLILAHTNQKQIELLLRILDSKRIDIFMHIDIKSKDVDVCEIKKCVKQSNLYFLESRDVRWGDYSLVSLELDIFKLALSKGGYCYYHLISGMDLPLKPIGTFLDFCESNQGCEFVNVESFCNRDDVCLYHIFPRNQRPANRLGYLMFKAIRKSFLVVQKILSVHKYKNNDMEFFKGSNWLSLTEQCVKYVVSEEHNFKRIYKYATCEDEKFIQTLLCNSETYKDKLYNELNGNLRLVDWKRGYPYVFRNSDFEELRNSKLYWARKFDMKKDAEVIRRIASIIHGLKIDI